MLFPSLVSGQGSKAPLRGLHPQCPSLSLAGSWQQYGFWGSSVHSSSLALPSASAGVSHGSVVCGSCCFPGQGDHVFIQGHSTGTPLGSFPTLGNFQALSGVCSALLVTGCNSVVYWSRLGQAGKVQEQGSWESCPDLVGLRKQQVSTALQLGLVLHGSSRAFPWGCQLVCTFGRLNSV